MTTENTKGHWEYQGHSIDVDARGNFYIAGNVYERSWDTLAAAREEIDKRAKHTAVAAREKIALPVRNAKGAGVITGVHRTTGKYTTTPDLDAGRFAATAYLYPDTTAIDALLGQIEAAEKQLTLLNKRLAACEVAPVYSGYSAPHITPESYPEAIAKAKANYARALEAVQNLEAEQGVSA